MSIVALRHARGETVIHRLNPLTKILIVLLFWLISLGQFNPVVLIAMIAVALVLWWVARIPLRSFVRLLAVLSVVFLVLTIINGFMFYNGRTVLFTVGPLRFTLEGFLFGITISLKILSVVTFIPVLTFTTPMPRLMAAMARLRLPYKFIFTFGVAMRFTPLVAETYRDIVASQRLRAYDLREMPVVQRVFRGYVPIFIPLILTLLRRAADLDIAIESRAFGAPVARTYLEELRFHLADYVAIVSSLAVFVVLMAYGSSLPQLVNFTHT